MRVDHLRGCGQILPQPGWALGHQVHEFSECLVVMGGRIHTEGAAGRIAGERGDILLYPAGCWHVEHSDRQHPAEVIFFPFVGEAGDSVRCIRDHNGRCRLLAHWLLDEQRSQRIHEALALQLARCIAEEVKQAEGRHPEVHCVDAVRRAIVAEPGRNWDLASLASVVHLSSNYFCRRYKASCGVTPMQDLKRLRVAAALDLVRGTDLPMRVIASRCGFANEYHLSRSCRQEAGYPPSHFRPGRNLILSSGGDPVS